MLSKKRKQQIGHLIKLFEFGKNNSIGRFQSIVSLILLGSSFLILKGYDISFEMMFLFGAVSLIWVISFGYFWTKKGYHNAMTSSKNLNNPEIMEIVYNTRNALKRLDELEKRMVRTAEKP